MAKTIHLKDYYKKISEVVNYDLNFETDESKPTGMKRKLIDSSFANNLGWSPLFSLEEGLEKLIIIL